MIGARTITVDFPVATFEALQRTAQRQNRPVADVVRDLVLRELPELPSLPRDVEAELASFETLSDDVLWLVARSALTTKQQQELARLNDASQQRTLSSSEQTRQQNLVDAYDRTILRRAKAAALLQQRGHNLTDPAILASP